jgi:hypothetical protein
MGSQEDIDEAKRVVDEHAAAEAAKRRKEIDDAIAREREGQRRRGERA